MEIARRVLVLFIGAWCLMAVVPPGGGREAHAEEAQDERLWQVGILSGFYQPSLRTLNRVLEEPRLAILQDPNQQLQPNVDFPPEVRNLSVPRFDERYGGTLGLEIERRYSARSAVRLMLSLWHSSTKVSDRVPFIAGPNIESHLVPRESLYDVQISQIWLAWRYALWQRSQREQVYFDLGLVGVAFAKLTITTLLIENTGAVDPPFAVASSLEANGFGVVTRWGVGGEYFINDRFSVSARTAYIIGRVPQLRVSRFFRAGFSVPPPPQATIDLPPPPNPSDVVTYADIRRPAGDPNTEVAQGTAALPLELNGLEFVFGIHFHF